MLPQCTCHICFNTRTTFNFEVCTSHCSIVPDPKEWVQNNCGFLLRYFTILLLNTLLSPSKYDMLNGRLSIVKLVTGNS